MSEKTGGPAFPVAYWDGDRMRYVDNGMTLRDYFAARAMGGFAADNLYEPETLQKMAKAAYKWADAMLEARK